MINQSSRFSVELDSGAITLVQYDLEVDPKFIEANVIAFDNLGNATTLMSSALIKVRHLQ